MTPSKQSLKSSHSSGIQLDFRLKAKNQLFVLQSPAQIALQFQPLLRIRTHPLGKNLIASAACRFGAIHGGIGIPQNIGRRKIAGIADGNPDAEADEHFPVSNLKRSPDTLQQAHGDKHRIIYVALSSDSKTANSSPPKRARPNRATLSGFARSLLTRTGLPGAAPLAPVR